MRLQKSSADFFFIQAYFVLKSSGGIILCLYEAKLYISWHLRNSVVFHDQQKNCILISSVQPIFFFS
jgi:hypothetical protein